MKSKLLTFIATVFFSQIAFAGTISGPSSSTGSYTISWSISQCYADYYKLYENGTADPTFVTCNSSKSYSGKASGAYSYKIQACTLYEDPFRNVCVDTTNNHTVIVNLASSTSTFNSTYGLRYGAYDGDGYTDFYVAGSGGIEPFVLRRDQASNSFSIVSNLSAAQKSSYANWPAASLALIVKDLNMDEVDDLYIGALGNYVTGAHDTVVYGNFSSNIPLGLTDVGPEMISFLDQGFKATADGDFFDNALTSVTLAGGYYYQANWYFSSAGSIITGFSGNTPIYEYIASPGWHYAWVYVATTTTIQVLAAHVSPTAYAFGPLIESVFASGGLIPGSSDSININTLFVNVMGVQVARGLFSSTSGTLPSEIGKITSDISKLRLLKMLKYFRGWVGILSFALDVSQYPYYHYTSDGGLPLIIQSGIIDPPTDSFAYFTTVEYETRTLAKSKVALPSIPVAFFVIPAGRLVLKYRSGPGTVTPRFNELGGGKEWTFYTPVLTGSPPRVVTLLP